MGTVVINGVSLACSRNPPVQINGQKVWSPDINLNGQMVTGVNINGYDYPPAPAGSVLYLPGLPGQGLTIWDRAKTNNGAIVGATWVRLPSGLWVLSFDGNDYVSIASASNLQLTGAGTVRVWINMQEAATDNHDGIVAKSNNYILLIPSGGLSARLRCTKTTNYDSGSATLVNGVWKHLVGVYNGATVEIYMNGVKQGTGAALTGNLDTTATVVELGRNYGSSSYAMTALLGMPSILNVAWTLAQIQNDYNQTRSLFGV